MQVSQINSVSLVKTERMEVEPLHQSFAHFDSIFRYFICEHAIRLIESPRTYRRLLSLREASVYYSSDCRSKAQQKRSYMGMIDRAAEVRTHVIGDIAQRNSQAIQSCAQLTGGVVLKELVHLRLSCFFLCPLRSTVCYGKTSVISNKDPLSPSCKEPIAIAFRGRNR